jgi:hypothetical protein
MHHLDKRVPAFPHLRLVGTASGRRLMGLSLGHDNPKDP